jgi:hypothetical protein
MINGSNQMCLVSTLFLPTRDFTPLHVHSDLIPVSVIGCPVAELPSNDVMLGGINSVGMKQDEPM